MTLPFATFEELLAWLAVVVAAVVASWLQERLKGTPWAEWASSKVVAVVFCALATAAVYAIQFTLGWTIFPEVPSPFDLVRLATLYIVTLVFNQAGWALAIRRK